MGLLGEMLGVVLAKGADTTQEALAKAVCEVHREAFGGKHWKDLTGREQDKLIDAAGKYLQERIG